MSRHWSDLFDGISYGLILFIFGNYSHTLSWITVAAFYPSLFGYALIAELPFTKTSLPNIKNWPKGMWAVFITAVANTNKNATQQQQEQADEGTTLLPVAATPQGVHNPYTRQVAIHLHHWQIFYVLAFFTRFDHPVSQVGAGIVLACYMEGICAYGYDRLVNDG
ncbi:hypothetical protein G6F42_017727 [Rhizopus arrhizus]|nr:hypothetical protein G6F42_017727 [Rhizopus arrhizus]